MPFEHRRQMIAMLLSKSPKTVGNSEEVAEEVRASDEEVASPLTVIEDTEEEEKNLN